MHRLNGRFVPILVAAIAAFVLSVVGAPAADAICTPGSLTLLPKPRFEPPRCEIHP